MEGLKLADPEYDRPGRIDILLGINIFMEVICHGCRQGPKDSSTPLRTEFGWVLAGNTGSQLDSPLVTIHLIDVHSGDDLLHKFWELEEKTIPHSTLTSEEHSAMDRFNSQHIRSPDGFHYQNDLQT